ncbi:dihydrolipoamide acetyltransferase family protein [Luteimonas terrae]|uniref:Dihydrolipoamide acetyltransferase component of pyruvate dehydrogenase complex n=1 Tax=Luteimonas terrae TaxID=1530191 RepID=A0ABU1XX72_9GAMM|nr:dihydrolipoamide acetyltransferase family protein [Luteimonas terrae]MDR7193313.1 2-oxoisovalerate dehydrogenase E2 component (dihydrolipoyl transacylase) [Luteimonas terrae]
MGHHVIKMPDIGEGIAEVEVIAWKVEVGGQVAEDQIVAEVMTDKAMVEIPSPVAGTVVSLGGKPGEMMAVGSELIRLEVEGAGNLKAGAAEPEPAAAKPAEAKTEPPKVEASKPAPAPEPKPAAAPAKTAAPAPAAKSDTRGAVTNSVLAAGEQPLASPAVRRRAWDLGIELRYVPATGPGGRILHADLDAYAEAGGKAQPVGGGAGGSSYARRTGEEQVPIMGLRRKIAQKMQQSWSNIPHITYVEEIDVTEVEALRAKLNDRWGKTRGKLTLLPLLARAVVLAARDFPQMNARFDDEANIVTRYEGVQLGIATQSAVGLSVPVIAHAESLDLWQTAAEIGRLAAAVREGKATRDELSGSTITISSLGPVGGVVSTPIINHPEVAIVGVNRIIERPMFREGQVVARKLMNLSSSFDHRIVDGMDAAEFVQAIRQRLETPALLFVE